MFQNALWGVFLLSCPPKPRLKKKARLAEDIWAVSKKSGVFALYRGLYYPIPRGNFCKPLKGSYQPISVMKFHACFERCSFGLRKSDWLETDLIDHCLHLLKTYHNSLRLSMTGPPWKYNGTWYDRFFFRTGWYVFRYIMNIFRLKYVKSPEPLFFVSLNTTLDLEDQNLLMLPRLLLAVSHCHPLSVLVP